MLVVMLVARTFTQEMIVNMKLCKTILILQKHDYVVNEASLTNIQNVRGMFEMNCLLSSSSISTWGTIKTNTYLYRVIQYLHNGV